MPTATFIRRDNVRCSVNNPVGFGPRKQPVAETGDERHSDCRYRSPRTPTRLVVHKLAHSVPMLREIGFGFLLSQELLGETVLSGSTLASPKFPARK